MQITQSYAKPSSTKTDTKGTHFDLSAAANRKPVSLNAMVNNSLSYARLMLALHKVVTGDWRSPKKDYSKYQEWVQQRYLEELPAHYGKVDVKKLNLIESKKELEKKIRGINKLISPMRKAMRQKNNAYWDYIAKHDKEKLWLFDPVISVHPDTVIFEAFSLDESSYGRVSLPTENLEIFEKVSYGTTNIDFSQALADEIYRIRSYRPAWLKVAYEKVELSSEAGTVVEKKIDLPNSWLKGFLQVQSASAMPGTNLKISSATLIEVLSVLKRKNAKVSPRSLRFQLTPNEYPSIIIDPWGIEVKEFEFLYQGDYKGEIRVWGRKRLEIFEEVLPFAEEVNIKLLGTGMPSYWSLELEGHRFDLGLSGWTTNDWARKAIFDLLASNGKKNQEIQNKLEIILSQILKGSAEFFSDELGISQAEATSALQELCKQGKAMYDHILGVYRWRKLLEEDIRFEENETDTRQNYGQELFNEQKVHFLAKENDKTFKFRVSGKNEFKTELELDEDGRSKYAQCSCGFFRRNKLKQGPCSHIIASALKLNTI